MMTFVRPLFALLVMGLVAAALVLATLSWVESHPARRMSAADPTAESCAPETMEFAER